MPTMSMTVRPDTGVRLAVRPSDYRLAHLTPGGGSGPC